jgi:hypothetical protein
MGLSQAIANCLVIVDVSLSCCPLASPAAVRKHFMRHRHDLHNHQCDILLSCSSPFASHVAVRKHFMGHHETWLTEAGCDM